MKDIEAGENEKRKASRPVIYAILGAALLVALGLAVGLGLGLRSLRNDEPQAIQASKPPTTRVTSTATSSTTPAVTLSSTPATTTGPEKSKTGSYRFAAVASDAGICSDIGTNVLAVQQGSAVDAAIATMLCIGVVHRQSCGIGGGFFMTIYNRTTQTTHVLDARERAPLAANQSLYVGRQSDASTFGGLAIAVPGDIMGYWEAHQKFGRVPWKDLFQPTINLCKDGVPILAPIYRALTLYKEVLRNMSHTMYFHPETGEMVKVGDKVRYPVLAETLETIAEGGAPAFYNGSLTDLIVNDIQDHGGIITREDLNQYTATWRTPLSTTLRDNLTIFSVPPPGSGVVYEYILNILDGYNFTPDDLSSNQEVLTYHRIVEAMKFAYAKRTELGDEDFVNVTELLRNLTSRDFANDIRSQITDRTHDMAYYGPTFFDEEKTGTSHSSYVDVHGNSVAMTSTINTYFGSKVRGNRTGVAFNNEMDDFSTPGLINSFGVAPSPANFIEPRKRPLSSMCPSVVVNSTSGDVVLAIGASGGTRITTAVALISLFTLRLGLPIADAVDHRRLHHQLLPQRVVAETGFSQDVLNGLKAKGHNITSRSPQSVSNPIHVTKGMLEAVSDVRKGGAPSGY